ncbi:Integrase catalytic subunit [Pantoea sp. Sc1]|nr:Integrase catalytic subunit [Pantoea sp. Sc1]
MDKQSVLNALLMAVRRHTPQNRRGFSDQGSQYTCHEWWSFLKSHGVEVSMSHRGNCHDNAVAESFFQLLKQRKRTTNRVNSPQHQIPLPAPFNELIR